MRNVVVTVAAAVVMVVWCGIVEVAMLTGWRQLL